MKRDISTQLFGIIHELIDANDFWSPLIPSSSTVNQVPSPKRDRDYNDTIGDAEPNAPAGGPDVWNTSDTPSTTKEQGFVEDYGGGGGGMLRGYDNPGLSPNAE